MPIRKRTPEEAVDAVADAIREITAAASNLEARMPENAHQERAVRVMRYEVDEMSAAMPVLRGLLAPEQDAKAKS